MTELLPSPTSLAACMTSVDLPSPVPPPVSSSFQFEPISKTILNLTSSAPSALSVPGVSASAIESMQRLVTMVRKLRALWTDSEGVAIVGLSTDLAPTSENLAPYLTEETYETLEALQNPFLAEDSSLTHPDQQQFYTALMLVDDLIPRLLWTIARGSYDLMRLLGGVRATILLPSEPDSESPKLGWRSGILRLVAVLAATTPKIGWIFDLVTHQSPPTPLASDILIRSDDGSFCKQPTAAETLLQQLIHHIHLTTPEVNLFTSPAQADFLEPGKDWQSGSIHLNLTLAFVASDEATDRPPAPIPATPIPAVTHLPIDLDVETLAAEFGSALEEKPLPEKPLPGIEMSSADAGATTQSAIDEAIVRLTGQALYAEEQRAIVKSSLEAFLQSHAPDVQVSDETSQKSLMLALVQVADQVGDRLSNADAALEESFLRPEILVDEWMPKLLWHLTRSSYAVMQFIGGVKARALQPEQGWQVGTLRLLVELHIATDSINWHLDGSTGQVLAADRAVLASSVVVQSDEAELCPEPERVETMMTRLTEQIQTITPAIELLMVSTSLDVLQPHQDWQPGTLQLSLKACLER